MSLRDGVALSTFLLFAALAAGCGSEETCSGPDDCFAGEVCNLGRCEAAGPTNGTTADGGMTSDASNPDGMTGNGAPNGTPNSSMGTDGDAGDVGDAGSGDDMSSRSDVCIVSPFDVSCESDGNDDTSVDITTMTKACVTDDENFQPMDETVSALLCALEERDRYSQAFGECVQKSFVTEVRLTPRVPCDPEDILFSVSMQGKSCANQDESSDITCTVDEDGSMLAQIVVRPSAVPAINLLRIKIEPTRENVHFEYDLNVVMK